MTHLGIAFLNQRGHLFNWVPVCLACGIGLYFSLKFEPSQSMYVWALALAISGVILGRLIGVTFAPVAYALSFVSVGFCIAGYRAHQHDQPVLTWRYYGPVEGRIVDIDRSASDAIRLTLDQVVLYNMSPQRTPDRVRISLHADASEGFEAKPGLRVMTTANISPPNGPVEPGGFDFQRHAWFLGLGGVGYSRVPVLTISEPAKWEQTVFRIRKAIAARVQEVLPGELGGVAVAISTGDRSGIGQETLDDLRASNLAHLLAISGLHMGLVAGFVFASVRLIFASLPYVAMRLPSKKIAAVAALFAASLYLVISGGNVATQRAYIMVAVALIAVLFDRRAISLRGVAMAATLVLVLWPSALMGPGFQMSFAATTALVGVFGWLRDHPISMPKWFKPIFAVLVSSGIAGLATAPIGAAHFNMMSHYGLLANLVSVPLMGAVVMPAAVVAMCLALVGLEALGLWVMGKALSWILFVAETVAGWPGARSYIISPDAAVLPVMVIGFLMLILWQGRARIVGVMPVIIAFVLWSHSTRPDVLIAANGSIVGVMSDEGRALSKERGAAFVALNWLENDGDGSAQEVSAARWQTRETAKVHAWQSEHINLVHLVGKGGASAFKQHCQNGALIISSIEIDTQMTECEIYDVKRLRDTGALAVYVTQDALRVVTASEVSGARLWNTRQNWR